MEIKITEINTYNIKYITITCLTNHMFAPAIPQNEPGYANKFIESAERNELWFSMRIYIDNGKIENWRYGKSSLVVNPKPLRTDKEKICYIRITSDYYDNNIDEIKQWNYSLEKIPSMFCNKTDNGNCINLKINEHGCIEGWNPNLKEIMSNII